MSKRINIKNIINLENFVNKNYKNVIIEINGKSDLKDLKYVFTRRWKY